ncbi:MFS transporter [Streptomyces tsukubensis]|uniref:MFS transporter n=1 Tax=Streptomyces tsukubensis (strain DSM 42081 / NBRC 108919 / NRRL 18488 / 9993) TaxID=1114943 RepID=A0A7G3UJP2_STRT9|nr:MFS transporter [Streptomyces tsukubensis]AZK94086.1 MFS transporter [Streptomyces tsukubensis]QKM69801.1 MFS transporter [Streptomyces tsukubensis NRRL18488]TAI46227.1 MFS transporter [Streptomyces tsukubensis]
MTPHLTRGAPPRPPRTLHDRAAVLAVAAATFTVVTSEMLPVGLLSPMSGDLGVSEGTAGLAITLPGLVAAFAAPLLPAIAGRADRRRVLTWLLLLLALANAVAALAPRFGVLLAARIAVGLAIGGVWAIAAGLAHRLVPPAAAGRATAVVFGGIALASVLGIPVGALIGHLTCWEWGFAAVAALALAVAGALRLLLPPLPPERAVHPRETAALTRMPAVRTGLVVVALMVTGHFTAYTYVRPVLEGVDGVPAGAIGGLLLLYGLAGVAGNFLGGAAAARSPRRALLTVSAALAAVVPLLGLTGSSAALSMVLLVLWGLAYGGLSVSAQNWMLVAAPGAREAVSGLCAGVFNASIALGAAGGGAAMDRWSTAAALLLAGALALLAALTLAGSRRIPAAGLS